MLTVFEGQPFDYSAYIVDSSNTPVNMATASALTLTLTHQQTAIVIGPITGAAGGSPGYATFPLTTANLADTGVYDVQVAYTIGGVSELSFLNTLTIIARPSIPVATVQSGAASVINFNLTDASGSPIDITTSTVLMFTLADHTTALPIAKAFTVVSAPSGIISASFTEISKLFGYVTVDGLLTSEFIVAPILV